MNIKFLVGCNDSTEPTLSDYTYTCQRLSSLTLRPNIIGIVAIMSPLPLGISYPATSPGIQAPYRLAGASIISSVLKFVYNVGAVNSDLNVSVVIVFAFENTSTKLFSCFDI